MEGVLTGARGVGDAGANQTERGEVTDGQRAGPHEKLLLLQKNSCKPWPRTRAKVKGCLGCLARVLCRTGVARWMCLAALGILTALTSCFMDFTTDRVLNAQRWLMGSVGGGVGLQYLVWIVCPIALTTFGTGFTQSVCPQSAGSGVPEVKTIMGGVPLPDYLTLNNLIAKIVGMTCTLAAGSPVFLGKLGPFVHLSTMVGAFLNRLLSIVCEVGEESFHYEMLVCSAAVAMASCFGCPISGVLFSVEVMSSHFATKNYCRSFFTAICGAMMFRILAICSNERETILPLLSTSFPVDFPFDLPEMVFFAVLGLLCGLLCVVYLFGHRWIIRFTLKNKILKKLLTTEKTLYTGLVVFVLASMTFPGSVGWLMASRLSMRELLTSLLDSQAWVHLPQNSSEPWPPAQVDVKRLWLEWTPPGISVFTTLGVFLSMKFWLLLLACTIPMPAGYFMPVYLYGAAIGRLVGEFVAFVFPEGIQSEGSVNPINPGGYALAGAAAFSGAVTHTLSPGLLVLEMTGQLYHSLPVLLAVLLSNAVCRRFSPNFYDGIILIKKLPYLPMVLQYHPELCAVKVSQLMKRSVTVLARCGKAGEVRAALTAVQDSEIPVVDTLDSMILLGSVCRSELIRFLQESTGSGLDRELGEVCIIQPTTAQLLSETTIKQAHAMLTVLDLHPLYVTEGGKLVGVMSSSEMKKAIEDLANGKISPPT